MTMNSAQIRSHIEESIAVKREMLATQLEVIERMCALCIARARGSDTVFHG